VRQSIEGSASTDGEVRERLARLEKLMEMMIVGESGGVATRNSPSFGVAVAKNALPNLTHSPSISPSLTQLSHTRTTPVIEISSAPVGQIVFKELHSAYFDSDFWAGHVTEVGP
jgi:hypothetical protein